MATVALKLSELTSFSPMHMHHAQSQDSLTSTSQADESVESEFNEELDAPSTPESEPAGGVALRPQKLARRGRWHLVWCHERVHKPGCQATRKSMSEVARKAGASLVCLKKASKFMIWLSQANRPPYVLLTDWREVKPCLQAASACPHRQQPSLTVVIAEEQRHFERASNWAASMSLTGQHVRVCQDAELVRDFLNGLSDGLSIDGSTQEEQMAASPVAALSRTTPALGAFGPKQLPDLAGAFARAQSSRQLQALADWALPAAQGLAGRSPAEVERILLQAMPDHYDD